MNNIKEEMLQRATSQFIAFASAHRTHNAKTNKARMLHSKNPRIVLAFRIDNPEKYSFYKLERSGLFNLGHVTGQSKV